MVDTASLLAYHSDPRNLDAPSPYEQLWAEQKKNKVPY